MITTKRRARIAPPLAALAAAVILAGCGNDVDDLQQFVQQVESRPAPRLEPIPEIKPYESYAYKDDALRSPFQAPVKTVQSDVRPNAHRNKEYLEQFPLDSLRMVGTITMDGVRYALIRDNDGTVHRVRRGNYMGQNDGRIVKITDEQITLHEIVPNGLGGYVKRETDMVLAGSKAGQS